MFLTALAGNPLAAAIAESQGIHLSWGNWALAASIPGLICLLFMPLIVYFLYPPQMKELPNAREIAKKRIKDMGKMSRPEIIMLLTFITLLLLWTLGDAIGIHATVAALAGIVVLLVSGVLTWDDILKERTAWGTFIWFGALIMLAGQLETSGFLEWFSIEISNAISNFNWILAFVTLTLLYFYAHYFFASTTALITTIYAVFLQVMLTSQTPAFAAAMTLAAFSCLSSCLTHYGTGSAPVYFGANYVSMRNWWTIGAILSVFYILIWWIIGTAWWQLIGLM
jgi:DASS family divalent anion:Na+ symporter